MRSSVQSIGGWCRLATSLGKRWLGLVKLTPDALSGTTLPPWSSNIVRRVLEGFPSLLLEVYFRRKRKEDQNEDVPLLCFDFYGIRWWPRIYMPQVCNIGAFIRPLT